MVLYCNTFFEYIYLRLQVYPPQCSQGNDSFRGLYIHEAVSLSSIIHSKGQDSFHDVNIFYSLIMYTPDICFVLYICQVQEKTEFTSVIQNIHPSKMLKLHQMLIVPD